MKSIVEILSAKRDGHALSDAEIQHVIAEFAAGRLPDYQMSALAMAIFFRGLDGRETQTWTAAMLASGLRLTHGNLTDAQRTMVVDKHSTGGVGDKISLPLAPAAAACGVIVPMIAGRGLGHTGGTIDKLESVPGFKAELDEQGIAQMLEGTGCCITGQTDAIVPADKRLYALRDVTATVESIPLIIASIMSKKLAEGLSGLVLDVKVGRGAFMPTLDQARILAEGMVRVGEAMGTKVIAYLTRMDEPLGVMVGNACEVMESCEILAGGGPSDVRELVVTLGGAMVELAHGLSLQDGRQQIAEALDDGSAQRVWEQMVAAQGGRLHEMELWDGETVVRAPRAGWIEAIDSREVGLVGVGLGAGRVQTGAAIDHRVGIRIDAKRGQRVEAGAPLATILHGARSPREGEASRLAQAFTVSPAQPVAQPLIIERISS